MFSLKGKQVKQSWKALKLKLPSVHVVILSPLLEVIEQILDGVQPWTVWSTEAHVDFHPPRRL